MCQPAAADAQCRARFNAIGMVSPVTAGERPVASQLQWQGTPLQAASVVCASPSHNGRQRPNCATRVWPLQAVPHNAPSRQPLAIADAAHDRRTAVHGDTGYEHIHALRFVRRMHRMRTLGLALGFLCVASVLRLHDAAPVWWAVLIVNAFAWPHAARWLAARDAHPRNAELSDLLVDSALGGVWVAVMQFDLLPSALLVTMLAVDKVSVGDRRCWRAPSCCWPSPARSPRRRSNSRST